MLKRIPARFGRARAVELFCVLASLTLIHGCAADLAGTFQQGAECTSDLECPGGTCGPAGTCESIDACQDRECCIDSDCGPGQRCQLNSCVDETITTPEPSDGPCRPELSVSPGGGDCIDFGAVQIGVPARQTLTIQNGCDQALNISEISLDANAEDSGDFTIELGELGLPLSVEQGTPVTFDVVYTPSDPDEDAGNLLIVSNDPDAPLTQVCLESQLKGEAIAAVVTDIDLACEELDQGLPAVTEISSIELGSTGVGGTLSMAVSIVNAGSSNRPLEIREMRLDPGGREDLILDATMVPTEGNPMLLPVLEELGCEAEGVSLDFTLTFNPQDLGDLEQTLVIRTSDTERQEIRLPVRARSVLADMAIDPDPLEIGTRFFGQAMSAEITVRNTGTQDYSLVGLMLLPEGEPAPTERPAEPCMVVAETDHFVLEGATPETVCGILEEGEEKIFTLRYLANGIGEHGATVVVFNDAEFSESGDGAIMSSLVTARTVDPPVASIAPSQLDFGEVQVNTTACHSVFIDNEGGSALQILTSAFAAPTRGIFTIDPLPIPAVGPAQVQELLVCYAPTEVAPHSNTFEIATNDPELPNQVIALLGSGIAPELSMAVTSVDFGEQPRGTRVGPRLVTISNVGVGAFTIASVEMGDGSSSGFELVGLPDLPATVRAGAQITFEVFLTPRAGLREAVVLVEHDVAAQSSPMRLELRGVGRGCPDGFGDNDDNPDDCEYECPVFPIGPERCNGADDDCDGEVDDGFNIGGTCTAPGACGAGLVECATEFETRCSSAPGGTTDGSSAEQCDDIDNDCDTLTDEDYDVGRGCDGAGLCGAGRIECSALDATRCSTEPGGLDDESVEELCDGFDNDCDTAVDEDFGVGEGCLGFGECKLGVVECAGPGETQCSSNPGGTDDQSSFEICDLKDNDCDQDTDEGYDVGEVCDGVGECGEGIVECAGPTVTRCSTDAGGTADESSAEVCDTVDNDCDGRTDEGFNTGAECEGIGACGAGVIECAGPGETRCSTNPGGSVDQSNPEICDGIDNDCDGLTDEGFDIGAECDGEGACGLGTVECASISTTRCSTEPGGSEDQSTAEICDTLDNNCDGEVNEGFFLGDVCEGAGECGEGVIECDPADNTQTICSTEGGGSADETQADVCDTLDNDCDGEVDEDYGTGVECDGEGECGVGTVECAGEMATRCSTEPGGSADESMDDVCDSLDNNCDGATDEAFSIGDVCDGIGLCGEGVIECKNELETFCSTDAGGSADQSAPELCDGMDNNCDGVDDDGFGIGLDCDGVGECGAGVVECADELTTRCSTELGGSAEEVQEDICDTLDNDCDGDTDEDWGTGVVCEGEGECGEGIVECAGPGGVRCSTEKGGSGDQSVAESCDSLDNNCDGNTDEHLEIGDPCDGIGACGLGRWECATENSRRCSTDALGTEDESVAETCDGIDNDCDGSDDEDFEIGLACDGVGECGEGLWECAGPNNRRCSTDRNGTFDETEPEICDGLDNDCDGSDDETFGIGTACSLPGVCGAGQVECDGPNSTQCSSIARASAEICDGQDNDCDGETDEGFNIGESCDGIGRCGAGQRECDPDDTGRTICSTEPRGSIDQSSAETCNSLDDDCDGETDESFNIGAACTAPGECGAGVIECAGDADTRCSTGPGGSADKSDTELCDGLDNDCDGTTDDGSAQTLCGLPDFTNGVACNGASGCSVSSCTTTQRIDDDGIFSNGCECALVDESSAVRNDSCANAEDLGTFSDADVVTLEHSGNLAKLGTGDDEDWYKVSFVDSSPTGTSDAFNARIELFDDVDGRVEFEVYWGSCTGTRVCKGQRPSYHSGKANLPTMPNVADVTEYQYRTNFFSSPHRGEGNCLGGANRGSPGTGRNQCNNDSHTVYIKVKMINTATVSCDSTYRLRISNQ